MRGSYILTAKDDFVLLFITLGTLDQPMTRSGDIPTDWLYKGKRKTAPKSGTRRSRSASISNGALSQGGTPVPPEWDKHEPSQPKEQKHKQQQAAAAAASFTPVAPAVPPAPTATRARSSSVTSSDLKRTDSLGERSKRSLFGSLFGKKNSPTFKEPSSPEVRPQTPARVPSPTRIALNKTQPKTEAPVQEISTLKLKRVNFAVDKFDSDPPQQLPSRKPRVGNVLVPSDMISEAPPISQGITTHGSSTTTNPTVTKDSREYKLALEEYKRAAKESMKHQQEAHYAAQRIEHEVANFKNHHTNAQTTKTQVANPEIDRNIANLSIDKPIHMHEHHFAPVHEEATKKELTLDVVYTRCCHLREILPIPSTLRQVKGKTAPLHTLKFLNPKPTLIDILSFCDFISVVPINTVVFDKVALTPEMFKTVMVSLVNSQSLEKLSLRNVNIDQQGWKVFCKFLLTNKSLTKLDISQTKVKADCPEGLHRDKMDWSLFAQVLTKRKGKNLEELLLNGIKFSKLPLETFQRVLNSFSQRENLVVPLKLGVATSDINLDCLKFLLTWMSENKIQGVDLAFNDLSNFTKPLVSKLCALDFDHLEYFTLNSTGIPNAYDLALILKYLSTMPNLKFLDLSSLPQVFPDAFPYMYKYLPRFPSLSRIHIDSNGLNFKDVSMACSILAKCKSLTHVSLMSQGPLVEIAEGEDEDTQKLKTFARNALSATLYAFVRDLGNLVALDIDYENLSDEIKSRIALLLMRNVNKNIDSNFHLDDVSSQDDLLFDGSLITETAEDILKRLENEEEMKTDATRRYLTKKYFEKLQKVHHKVQSTIDEMFDKRSSGELPLREKENLVRLLLLEKNLSNIMEIFSNVPNVSQVLGTSSLSLPGLKHVGSEAALSAPSSSDQDLNTNPHVMAADSGSIIDCITGKPLLLREDSMTSALGKRQEEEEGELHKWGFFVQQQRSLYPDSDTKTLTNSRIPSNPTRSPQNSQTSSSASSAAETKVAQPRILPKIPSGAELRDAIIKAKGIDSIEDLIHNVNSEHVELESIYGGSLRSSDSPKIGSKIKKNDVVTATANDDAQTDATVKQSYENLLNNLKMDRPPKKGNINPTQR